MGGQMAAFRQRLNNGKQLLNIFSPFELRRSPNSIPHESKSCRNAGKTQRQSWQNKD